MRIVKNLSMQYEEEQEISNYCKENGVSFSGFARDILLKKVREEKDGTV